MKYLFYYLIIINIIGFSIFGIDKYKAIHNQWRIPEKILFLTAILGGAIGCYCGMKVFSHKTLHKKFTIGIPVIIFIQFVLFFFLVKK